MPALPQVGTEFAGYRLRAVLARGGMSVVFHAENPRLGNIVALKVLAPELATDDTFRARFLQESRIAASLNHPNVIPIYDTGPCDDLLYIAMRYVTGADLRSVLKAHERISAAQALLLLGQAGRALDAAHRHGLVHRDVKPANILIERGADEEEPDHVYLADFGITKHSLSRSGLTATGQFVGTIDYIAPEQIQGRHVDGRADIYSLGCVLYESLTGRVPFLKDLDAAVIWAHVEEPPTPPTALQPELPHHIDDVIVRALAKDPDDRYDTCRAFIAAAREALEPARRRNGTTAAGVPAGPETVLAGTPVAPAPDPIRSTAAAAGAPRAPAPGSRLPGLAARGAEPPSFGGGDVPPRGPAADDSGGRGRRLAGAGIAVLVLAIAAGVAIWLLSSGGSSHHAVASHRATPTPMTHKDTPLMHALDTLNTRTEAKGLLPPSSCEAHGAAEVMCTNPVPGVGTVTFRTFQSLNALYAAYVDDARSLASNHQFRMNYGDCLPSKTEGEVSWNHDYKHLRKYTLAQSRGGMLDDRKAAGRVYCTFSQSRFHIVWTMNDGRLLGSASGGNHELTWSWWREVHHNIDLSAASGGHAMSMSDQSHSK